MRWRDLSDQFLFGLVDGINGAVGLVIGLLRSNAAAALILVALLSRAGSSAVSMAGAQYESDETGDPRRLVMARVAAMGAGYLSSALAPGIGFAFGRTPGLIVFTPAALIVLALITRVRARQAGWLHAAGTTLAIFLLAVGAGLGAGLIAG